MQRKRTQDFKLDAHLAAEIDVETESFAMEGVLETAEDCTGASSGEFLSSRIGAHLWGVVERASGVRTKWSRRVGTKSTPLTKYSTGPLRHSLPPGVQLRSRHSLLRLRHRACRQLSDPTQSAKRFVRRSTPPDPRDDHRRLRPPSTTLRTPPRQTHVSLLRSLCPPSYQHTQASDIDQRGAQGRLPVIASPPWPRRNGSGLHGVEPAVLSAPDATDPSLVQLGAFPSLGRRADRCRRASERRSLD